MNMTHSGGKPHHVGDKGQRYEVRAHGWPKNETDNVIGWSNDEGGTDRPKLHKRPDIRPAREQGRHQALCGDIAMTYDQWKCTDPREYEPEPEPCDHDDYDIDTIEGRCHCSHCGDSWHASEADIQAAIDSEILYAQYVERLESPWYRFQEWCSGHWYNFKLLFRPEHRASVSDDDIPF